MSQWKRKPDQIAKLQLRIKEQLRRELAHDAKRNKRSLNAEIIYRLQAQLNQVTMIECIEHAVETALVRRIEDAVLGALQAHFTDLKGPIHGEAHSQNPQQDPYFSVCRSETILPDRGC